MKVQFLAICVLIMMAITVSGGYATNYYISNETGDDNRTLEEAQHPATPWKSIEKVNTQFNNLKPGDAILFKRGETFYGNLHIKASGSATSPITIGGYGSGSKPIITSFQPVKGWKAIGDGIFESIEPVNSNTVQVLLIDGKLNEMGRYPNVGIENNGYMTINKIGNNVIYSDQLISSHNWKGAEVVIRAKDWIINKYKIESQTSQQIQYNGSISPYKAQVGYGFFIQNHIGTLDSFGEWYFNASTKKIYAYLGNVDPSTMAVEVSTLDNLLTKDYLDSNITIENIQFRGANGNTLQLEGGNNIKISDSEIEFSGEDGILALSVSDLVIERNIVQNTYNNSLYLRYGNNGAIIRDNEISNTALVPGRTRNDDAAGIGIFVGGEKILVQNNSVINSGFNGIQFSGNYTIIENNFVDTFCLIKSDGGGIYTFGGREYQSYIGRRIEGNIVVNGIGSIAGAPKRGVDFKLLAEGIFVDDNSNNIAIIDNTVGNTTNSGLKISNATNIDVFNNLFFNNQYAITLGNSIIGRDTRKVNIANNQFFTKLADQYSYGIKTYKNDVSLMADFDKNYFFRPLGDEFSILNQYEKNGEIEKTTEDLTHWIEKYNKDQNSISNTIDISTYAIDKKIGNSLYPNSSFDKNVAGVSCNDCQQSWEANGKLPGGALKITSAVTSSVKINLGALRKDKTYVLSLKGYANMESHLEFNLRLTGRPWERLSSVTTIKINEDVNSFEVLVSPYQDESEVSLMIHSSEDNITYWLDDLEFVEAEASFVNPEEVMVFELNPSKSSKTITLAGTYVNAKLEQFSGNVTIPPYGSLALFRISEISKPNENLQELYYHTGNEGTVKFNDYDFEKINSEFITSPNFKTNTNIAASNEKIFQSEIYGSLLEFQIPVKNGTYTVYTMHNELLFGQAGVAATAGKRVFDIALQGEVLKSNYDLFVENKNYPMLLSFENIVVSEGKLTLEINAKVNNASISGIVIIGTEAIDATITANLRSLQKYYNSKNKDMEFFPNIYEGISTFPNPAKEAVTLEISAEIGKGSIFIHNMNGDLVSHFGWIKTPGIPLNIPIENLSKGMYFIFVSNENTIVYQQKLIVNP